MTSLFQVIAHEDANDQSKLRQAMALAHQRVEDRFGTFVRKGSVDDQAARYSLVEDDVKAVIVVACEQVGFADVDRVLSSIGKNFVTSEAVPQLRTASVRHEARKPKMCPYHSEVTDISLAAGDAQAGFNAMAQHAWGPKHCQGEEYNGDKCKFKPAMTTQAYWDERAEKAEQRRQERAEREQLQQEQEVNELSEVEAPEAESVESVPSDTLHDGFEGGEPVAEVSEEIPMAMAASTRVSDYQYVKPAGDGKWKIIQKGTGKTLSMHDSKEQAEAAFRAMEMNMHGGKTATETTGLGETETPIDKRRWTPKTVGDPDPESEYHPNRRKDVTEPIVEEQGEQWNPSKITEIGENTTERQDVTQKGGIDRPANQGSGVWTEGPKTAVSGLLDPELVRQIVTKFER